MNEGVDQLQSRPGTPGGTDGAETSDGEGRPHRRRRRGGDRSRSCWHPGMQQTEGAGGALRSGTHVVTGARLSPMKKQGRCGCLFDGHQVWATAFSA